jgi:hypothetical protein
MERSGILKITMICPVGVAHGHELKIKNEHLVCQVMS